MTNAIYSALRLQTLAAGVAIGIERAGRSEARQKRDKNDGNFKKIHLTLSFYSLYLHRTQNSV